MNQELILKIAEAKAKEAEAKAREAEAKAKEAEAKAKEAEAKAKEVEVKQEQSRNFFRAGITFFVAALMAYGLEEEDVRGFSHFFTYFLGVLTTYYFRK